VSTTNTTFSLLAKIPFIYYTLFIPKAKAITLHVHSTHFALHAASSL
jgi:hypothetical protein